MQRKESRTPTKIELDAYNKMLELTDYSLSVCKPKTYKDKNGNVHSDNHHVPARYVKIGEYIMTTIIDIGAMILEANEKYVGKNLNPKSRKENIEERIKLQNTAIARSYRVEHCIRMLHKHRPFADSTISYWVKLLCEARKSIIAWKDSTARMMVEF